MNRLATCLAALSMVFLGAGAAHAASDDDRFLAAMRLYHEARYAAAFGQFIQLADDGHAESARIALLMLRHGPTLYRSKWSATADQVQHWLNLASRRQPTVVADGGD